MLISKTSVLTIISSGSDGISGSSGSDGISGSSGSNGISGSSGTSGITPPLSPSINQSHHSTVSTIVLDIAPNIFVRFFPSTAAWIFSDLEIS